MNKKILILGIMLFGLTGCVEPMYDTEQLNTNVVTEEDVVQEKPLTKQVCDWTGWGSAEIIKEQAEQGYVYTGRSNSFWCGDDMLNFQLKESE